MRKQNKIILWPIYFDQTKTRLQGRRIPKGLAVTSPRLDELQKAAQKCGLQTEVVPDLKHPNAPWLKTGLVLATKNAAKVKIIRLVAEELSALRAQNRI